MRRGSILHYTVGGNRVRVVVISADRYNPGHATIALVRERTAPELTPAFLVPLSRKDWPTAAVVDLSNLRRLDPTAVAGLAGQVTPDTLNVLNLALRTYFGVPS